MKNNTAALHRAIVASGSACQCKRPAVKCVKRFLLCASIAVNRGPWYTATNREEWRASPPTFPEVDHRGLELRWPHLFIHHFAPAFFYLHSNLNQVPSPTQDGSHAQCASQLVLLLRSLPPLCAQTTPALPTPSPHPLPLLSQSLLLPYVIF